MLRDAPTKTMVIHVDALLREQPDDADPQKPHLHVNIGGTLTTLSRRFKLYLVCRPGDQTWLSPFFDSLIHPERRIEMDPLTRRRFRSACLRLGADAIVGSREEDLPTPTTLKRFLEREDANVLPVCGWAQPDGDWTRVMEKIHKAAKAFA